MSALIDVIGLLAVLANVLFALHIWSAVSASELRARDSSDSRLRGDHRLVSPTHC